MPPMLTMSCAAVLMARCCRFLPTVLVGEVMVCRGFVEFVSVLVAAMTSLGRLVLRPHLVRSVQQMELV